MSLLITPRGDPAPPGWLLHALSAVDPALSLKWVNGRWAIMLAWRQNDPRRELIRKGELTEGASMDVICFLPEDCSADDSVGYFQQAAKRLTESADMRAKTLLAQVEAHNTTQHLKNGQQTLDYIDEVGSTYMKPVRSFGSEPTTGGRKRTALPSNVTT